ncbi:MAG: hypothetical protein J0H89_12330 [Rhizobiales bacterium]|jgi:hypothetical protein|nr:hypothetical protein [Hyphomicrobiales bacterium]
MSETSRILDNLGPYKAHSPVAAFCDLSKRTFERFHDARGGSERSEETGREHLLTRLAYIGESTSTAVRLNVTWALSLPGMSLVRDRYEQAVRYSWLARQPDNQEIAKYIGSYYAKANKIFRGISTSIRDELDKAIKLEEWMTETPTKEQRHYLERWESLDLASMAKKRDELPSKIAGKVAAETLADLYGPIYQQFSSVSHGDMYAARMLGLHPAPTGQFVLAPDPFWPAMLCCYNALFDLIQCHESLAMFAEPGGQPTFDDLFIEWREISDHVSRL